MKPILIEEEDDFTIIDDDAPPDKWEVRTEQFPYKIYKNSEKHIVDGAHLSFRHEKDAFDYIVKRFRK